MSTEAWAILGVIVGAALGGFAQVIADLIRRRHEHTTSLRIERREAHTAMVGASTDAILGAIAADRASDQGVSVESVGLPSQFELGQAVNRARARVELVGATATSAAASELMTVCLRQLADGVKLDEFNTAHVGFVALARKDLDITPN